MRVIMLSAALCLASTMASATGPCGALKTELRELVTSETPGYTRAYILLRVPTARGQDPGKEARRAFFQFTLEIEPVGTPRKDIDGQVLSITHCAYPIHAVDGRMLTHSLKYRVRGWPIDYGSGGYLLRAQIYLPNEIVERKPRAYTVLNSGVSFRGEWSTYGSEPALVLDPD